MYIIPVRMYNVTYIIIIHIVASASCVAKWLDCMYFTGELYETKKNPRGFYMSHGAKNRNSNLANPIAQNSEVIWVTGAKQHVTHLHAQDAHYYLITILYFYANILLSYYIIILLSFYIIILLYYYLMILLYYYLIILLSYYIIVLLSYYSIILLYYYLIILLDYYNLIILLYYPVILLYFIINKIGSWAHKPKILNMYTRFIWVVYESPPQEFQEHAHELTTALRSHEKFWFSEELWFSEVSRAAVGTMCFYMLFT